jgi:HAD superfamily hydrolase (TIGR01484 family)
MKRLVVFDLDGTLAESKAPLDEGMVRLFVALLALAPVAVISGAGWPQFQAQLLGRLPPSARLDKLSLLPASGTQLYRYAGDWKRIYAEDFAVAERDTIVRALQRAVAAAGFANLAHEGETIEDRGSQVTFSALGQHAPLQAKQVWDPDFAKRNRIRTLLEPLLPGYSVRLGGTTSIDVTRAGIDKAYGIRKLARELVIALAEMIYVGDALFPGGNDYPVQQAGVVCIRLHDPGDTGRVIESIIACLEKRPADKASFAAISAGR